MNLKTVLTVCGSGPLAFIAGAVGLLAPSVVPAFADPLLKQTNLVSDVLPALINDPNLTNAWASPRDLPPHFGYRITAPAL
jgi:hypothetical protein